MKIAVIQQLGISDLESLPEYKELIQSGHQIVHLEKNATNESLIALIRDVEAIVDVNYPLPESILSKCPNLKMITVAFTGYDHIDIAYCKRNNILVCNAAGYSTNSVAELTLGLIFALYRKIPLLNDLIREGKDKTGNIGLELSGKTLGIIGTGTIGMRVAEIGNVFGCNLLGYSRTQKIEATNLGLKYVNLSELLSQSDIVTVHTPFNAETKDLIGEKELSQMKRTAIIIQTSRGGVINEESLAKALTSGIISGAGVDVFSQEPPFTQNPLLSTPNTVLTPHIAYATNEALKRRTSIAFDNILTWIRGNPQNVVS